MPNTNVPQNPDGATLEQLAQRICAGHQAVADQIRNALRIALDVGADLNTARKRVPHGKWRAWLMVDCSTPVRTAQLYAQLADHRTEIEDALQEAPDLSLRAALRLISNKSKPDKPKIEKKLDLVIAWRASTEAERTAALDQISLDEFYDAMPKTWRENIAVRVTNHLALKRRMVKATQVRDPDAQLPGVDADSGVEAKATRH